MASCTYTPTNGKHTYTSIPGKHIYTPTNGEHTYTPTTKADISMKIEELTNGSKVKKDQFFEWEGSAILDTFINVLGKNIEIQFDNGRILGSDFASAYIQMLQIASTQAMAWIQLSKDLSLKQRDLDIKESLNKSDIALKQRDLDMRDSLNTSEVALKQRDLDMRNSLNNSEVVLKQRDLDIKEAMNVVDTCIKNRQIALQETKTNSEIKVADRQIAGYDDNLVIKLLQAQLDAFSLIFSSGMVDLGDGDNALGPLHRSNLTETYNLLRKRVK